LPTGEPVPMPPNPLGPSSEPEVVLLDVGTEKNQAVTQASWTVPPPSADRAEVPDVVPAGTHRPQPTPTAARNAGYGHAPDYSWLTGELEYLRSRNVWRLRYSPADQEDCHGGIVLLVGDGLPSDCKCGQVVRVEGQLVNPDVDQARPPYWVRSFKVLKPAPSDEE